MTERLVVLIVLTAIGIGVAALLQRRRPDPPSAPGYRAPAQLNRAEFDHQDKPTLLAVFASVKCDSCPVVWDRAQTVHAAMAPDQAGRVGLQRIDVESNPDLHKRYKIDGVPTVVIVDADGVVDRAFFGPITENEIAEALERSGNSSSSN